MRVMGALVAVFTIVIRRLPIVRVWEALREDDIACASLGINRTTIKLAAFGISAAWGGFAGAFFATRQGFISPESFTFIERAIILAIVVMGGMGRSDERRVGKTCVSECRTWWLPYHVNK